MSRNRVLQFDDWFTCEVSIRDLSIQGNLTEETTFAIEMKYSFNEDYNAGDYSPTKKN